MTHRRVGVLGHRDQVDRSVAPAPSGGEVDGKGECLGAEMEGAGAVIHARVITRRERVGGASAKRVAVARCSAALGDGGGGGGETLGEDIRARVEAHVERVARARLLVATASCGRAALRVQRLFRARCAKISTTGRLLDCISLSAHDCSQRAARAAAFHLLHEAARLSLSSCCEAKENAQPQQHQIFSAAGWVARFFGSW